MINRVWSVTEAAMAARSWPCSAVFGTRTATAPAVAAMMGYASNERHENRISSPSWQDTVAEMFGQADRATSGGDPIRRHPQQLGEAFSQCHSAHVRVAVRRGRGRGDGFGHAGQWTVRHLVGGQLDRAGHGTSGHVLGQLFEISAGQHGGLRRRTRTEWRTWVRSLDALAVEAERRPCARPCREGPGAAGGRSPRTGSRRPGATR